MKENIFGDILGKGWHERIIPELDLKLRLLVVDVEPRVSLDCNEENDNKVFQKNPRQHNESSYPL